MPETRYYELYVVAAFRGVGITIRPVYRHNGEWCVGDNKNDTSDKYEAAALPEGIEAVMGMLDVVIGFKVVPC